MYSKIYEMKALFEEQKAESREMLQSEMAISYELMDQQNMKLVEQKQRIAMQEQQMEKEITEMRSILEEQKRRISKY